YDYCCRSASVPLPDHSRNRAAPSCLHFHESGFPSLLSQRDPLKSFSFSFLASVKFLISDSSIASYSFSCRDSFYIFYLNRNDTDQCGRLSLHVSSLLSYLSPCRLRYAFLSYL